MRELKHLDAAFLQGLDQQLSAIGAEQARISAEHRPGLPEVGDLEAMLFLVLMQAAKDAQEDLKAVMARVKEINEAKRKQRENLSRAQGTASGFAAAISAAAHGAAAVGARAELDTLSEMGEMESLRLQLAMDRMSKLMSTVSNLLKKIHDTAQSITQNLK